MTVKSLKDAQYLSALGLNYCKPVNIGGFCGLGNEKNGD